MSVSSTKENGTNAYDEAPTNDAEAAPSLELNLRLDENGRTSIDPARVPSLRSASAFDPDAKPNCIDLYGDGDENPSKRAKTDCELKTVAVDYSSQTALTNLHDSELEEAMDALLFDCEVIAIYSLSVLFLIENHISHQLTCTVVHGVPMAHIICVTIDHRLCSSSQNFLDPSTRYEGESQIRAVISILKLKHSYCSIFHSVRNVFCIIFSCFMLTSLAVLWKNWHSTYSIIMHPKHPMPTTIQKHREQNGGFKYVHLHQLEGTPC